VFKLKCELYSTGSVVGYHVHGNVYFHKSREYVYIVYLSINFSRRSCTMELVIRFVHTEWTLCINSVPMRTVHWEHVHSQPWNS
jgi:hypothetical protein